MRYYHGTVIRPPSAASSYQLPITYDCSHNCCTFCGTYWDKPFRVRPMEEVLEDIAMVSRRLADVRRSIASGRMQVVDRGGQLMVVL